MSEKIKNKKMLKRLVLPVLTAILVILLSACTFMGGLAGLVIDNAANRLYDLISTQTDDSLPENAVYGTDNDLAVGFNNGKIYAFWDGDASGYKLKVVPNNGTAVEYTNIQTNSFDLSEYGYGYSDNLQLFLYAPASSGALSLVADYYYNAIDNDQYNEFKTNLSGGWEDMDTYLASRYEFFELYNYMVIFRPNLETVTENGVKYYDSSLKMYFGYNYFDVYPSGTSKDTAFKTELASAIAAFEDSAGYSYSYEISNDYRTLNMYLRFNYSTFPTLQTESKNDYQRSAGGGKDTNAHYVLSETPRTRNFSIDDVEKEVEVESSDQLYFAIKKGYKPKCKEGSNAEYLYSYMRNVLARLNGDITPDSVKIHYIYDYLVDTVLYDYDFANSLSEDSSDDYGDLFSYKCLYLEGVFGMGYNKQFKEEDCVAICDGIAKAALCMMKIEGIDAIKVSGTSQGMAHAWNKVKLNGNWYLFDATWGNSLDDLTDTESVNHDYLLVADDKLHNEDKWYDYPAAPSTYRGYSFR